MRRRSGGLLAAAVLLCAGCGANTTDGAAPDTEAVESVETPVLAASTGPAPTAEVQTGSFQVLVLSPEGIDSPGLDAAVSTLVARPDTGVEVVATAAPDFAPITTRSSAALALMDDHTMSGYPARVVNGTAADAVATAFDGTSSMPDLVVIGITRGAPVGADADGSHAVALARMVADRGVPTVVVASAGDQPDIAGASVALTTLLDYELATLVDGGHGPFVLAVPACPAGGLHGPVVVDHAAGQRSGEPECRSDGSGAPGDDVAAFGQGFATLADVGRS